MAANRPPMPPSMAGTADGQPPRKPLPVDTDPFGAVGDYAGSFLIKSAVELRGGYDTNPGRIVDAAGLAVSGWSRRNFSRSPTGSGMRWSPICAAPSPAMATACRRSSMARFRRRRPISTGRISPAISTAALDVTDFTHITSELRLRVATDNPGSPNIAAGLAKYPVYATFGSTVGLDQQFNRLDVAAGATFDRTVYQNSTADRRLDRQQRRPRLQPVWRRRPRQLRI